MAPIRKENELSLLIASVLPGAARQEGPGEVRHICQFKAALTFMECAGRCSYIFCVSFFFSQKASCERSVQLHSKQAQPTLSPSLAPSRLRLHWIHLVEFELLVCLSHRNYPSSFITELFSKPFLTVSHEFKMNIDGRSATRDRFKRVTVIFLLDVFRCMRCPWKWVVGNVVFTVGSNEENP